jgi:hypothetical protein
MHSGKDFAGVRGIMPTNGKSPASAAEPRRNQAREEVPKRQATPVFPPDPGAHGSAGRQAVSPHDDRAVGALSGSNKPYTLVIGTVGKDTVSRMWRKPDNDWDAWNACRRTDCAAHSRQHGGARPARTCVRPDLGGNLERAMGFEPTTPTLARLCSIPLDLHAKPSIHA